MRDNHGKNFVALAKRVYGFNPRADIFGKFLVHFGTGVVEIRAAIVALFVSAESFARNNFATEAFTGQKNGLIGQRINTGVEPSQPASVSILRPTSGAMRSECPCGVRAKFRGHTEAAQRGLRFDVARNHE